MGFKSFDDTACRKARWQELSGKLSGGFDLDSGAEIKSPCCKITIYTRSRDDEPVSVGKGGDPAGLCVVSLWLASILQLVSALAERNRSDDFA